MHYPVPFSVPPTTKFHLSYQCSVIFDRPCCRHFCYLFVINDRAIINYLPTYLPSGSHRWHGIVVACRLPLLAPPFYFLLCMISWRWQNIRRDFREASILTWRTSRTLQAILRSKHVLEEVESALFRICLQRQPNSKTSISNGPGKKNRPVAGV